MAGALTTAAESFERTLAQLGLSGRERELGDPKALGRRAAMLVAADAAWHKHLGPLLARDQAQELLGVRSRQAVSDLVKRRRLLALPARDGRLLFPAFQFSPSGRPIEAMPAILRHFDGAAVDAWTVASWFATPQRLLRGMKPARWLRSGRDPEKAIEAARRTAGRLAH